MSKEHCESSGILLQFSFPHLTLKSRISQKLAGRIKELAERYEKPLPMLTDEVEELAKKVDGHLQNMGFKW